MGWNGFVLLIMLHIERFVNQLMNSNCYIVVDEELKHCFCIDPASEKSEREIDYIEQNGLALDYIFLTHEHTDHTWGVNALVEKYPSVKVICSEICKQNLAKEFQAYFLFYYDNPDYHYSVCQVDNTAENINGLFDWFNNTIVFLPTPGHSMGSLCVSLNGMLFSGDAIMQTKPYINKRNGSKELFHKSASKVKEAFNKETIVYPGHGDSFLLKDYKY